MRKHLVWALGLALAVGVASVATGANTQSITGSISPSKQSKNRFGPASLNTITQSGCQSPCSGAGAIKPATRAQIFYDDDGRIDTTGIPRCRESQVQGTTTQQALARCGGAKVGGGRAEAQGAGNPDPAAKIPVVVTAFNGVPSAGRPTILLHSRTSFLTTVLTGVLKRASGDYAYMLDVNVPPLAGNTALTYFQTKVQKVTRVRGVRHNYISVRCHDANKTWNTKGVFTYDGNPPLTVTDTQKCQVR